jgi:hypothetical protein
VMVIEAVWCEGDEEVPIGRGGRGVYRVWVSLWRAGLSPGYTCSAPWWLRNAERRAQTSTIGASNAKQSNPGGWSTSTASRRRCVIPNPPTHRHTICSRFKLFTLLTAYEASSMHLFLNPSCVASRQEVEVWMLVFVGSNR